MLIKIRRDSIRPNPNAGRDTLNIYGRETHHMTRVWWLFDMHGSCQGLFTVSEQAIGNSDNLDWHVLQVAQFTGPPSELFVAHYSVAYPVQQIRTWPEGNWLYGWEDPEVTCLACGAVSPVSQLLTDSLELVGEFESDDGFWSETNTKCPKCGDWDCLDEPLVYEQISNVPKEELPCVSGCSDGMPQPASAT